MPAITKNARQYWQGVFLCLLVVVGSYTQADCPAVAGDLQWAQLSAVVDGDTLRLSDGRKLRLIAINTPELGRDGRPDEVLARRAKQVAEVFLAGSDRIGLRIGADDRDHYGRVLAAVYDSQGRSLAAHLLSQGLGWQVTVPPNTLDWQCLQQHERQARRQQLGVWAQAVYGVQASASLAVDSTGFALLNGTVKRVTETRQGWWIELQGISLRVAKKHWHYFADQGMGSSPGEWIGRSVDVRGWIINRRHDKTVIAKGYPPLMMNLGHPAMLDLK